MWSWFEVEAEKKNIVVIDCGYINDEAARNRADRILNLGIGRRNLECGPSNRIFVKIPKSKQSMIFKSLPIGGKSWFGATNSYLDEEGEAGLR